MADLKTFHLYHHQPDPLLPEEGADRIWLINNAVAYSVVAVIQAPGVTEALQTAQCKAQASPLPRRTAVQAANLLRETLPGDVLVAEQAAWMVDSANQVRPIPYTVSRPWKSQRQFSGQQAAVETLAWSPDGTIIAAAAGDRRVVLHVVASDNEQYPRAYSRGEGYSITALAWSPRGSRLAAGHHNGDVHLWKPSPWQNGGATGSILICRSEEERLYVTAQCVAWSPDGERIFAGYADGMLAVWNANTGACLPLSHKEYHPKAITTLAFAPHNEFLLLSASADQSVRIWDRAADLETVYQHAAEVAAAVWSPDGRIVASCERGDPTIHLWDPHTGILLEHVPLSISSTHRVEACSLAWSPDGQTLAAGCDDSTIQFIDLAQRQHIHTYRVDVQNRQRIVALAWSPDGNMLVSTDRSTGIDIWQAKQDLEAAACWQPTPPKSIHLP